MLGLTQTLTSDMEHPVYLIDTNVISEARKGLRCNKGVRRFLNGTDPLEIYLPVQVLGEIRCGVQTIRQRGDLLQASMLDTWLTNVVETYKDRVLTFDLDCSQVWGTLMASGPQHPIDKQIAAIALIHNLTIVSRNVADFKGLGAAIYNPFE